MGAQPRPKGGAGERELIKKLEEFGFSGLVRGRQEGGANFPDVEGTPFWLESKRRERESWRDWLDQAITDTSAARDQRPPVVVGRRNRTEWCVFLRLEDFLEIAKPYILDNSIRGD